MLYYNELGKIIFNTVAWREVWPCTSLLIKAYPKLTKGKWTAACNSLLCQCLFGACCHESLVHLGTKAITGNVPSLALWVAGECGFNTAQHRGSKGDLLWCTPWALSHFNSMVMSCNHEDILLSKIIVTPLVIENWMWCHCKAFVSTREVCARIKMGGSIFVM